MIEKFITRERSIDVNQSKVMTAATGSEKKATKTRLYCNSSLNIRFTWCGEETQPISNCLI